MDDLISRTWLLAEYDKRHKGPPGGARKLIEEAPPTLGTNVAEVGTDLISRQEALDIVFEYAKRLYKHVGTPEDNEMYSYGRGLLLSIERNLKGLPSAEPKRETTTLKIGRSRNSVTMWYECAECGEPVDQEDAFCRRCGRGIIHE